jgi:mono/diheme cytochrome c family protein
MAKPIRSLFMHKLWWQSLLFLTLTLTTACQRQDRETVRVERGRYLVNTSGCHDCHTPFMLGPNGPEPDMSRMLSGHPENLELPPPPKLSEAWPWVGAATNTAFHGPWGTSYAMNLTPHPVTGLGPWNEELFIKTIRSGKHWGTSRPIMPPMPWSVYRQMTDEDLASIWAYLRTIRPIRNQPPAYTPPVDQ